MSLGLEFTKHKTSDDVIDSLPKGGIEGLSTRGLIGGWQGCYV